MGSRMGMAVPYRVNPQKIARDSVPEPSVFCRLKGFHHVHWGRLSSSGDSTATTFVDLITYTGFPSAAYSPSILKNSVATSFIRIIDPSSKRYWFQCSLVEVVERGVPSTSLPPYETRFLGRPTIAPLELEQKSVPVGIPEVRITVPGSIPQVHSTRSSFPQTPLSSEISRPGPERIHIVGGSALGYLSNRGIAALNFGVRRHGSQGADISSWCGG